MKFFQIFILLILLIYINCQSVCSGYSFDTNGCSERNIEIENAYCCYLKGIYKDDQSQHNQCVEVSQDDYHNFDKVMNYYEKYYNELSIDCNSYSLYMSLLLLIFTIILLN